MAIYGHIWLYMDIYVTIYDYVLYFRCLDLYLGVRTCILDVWTCIWVSGLVFWALDTCRVSVYLQDVTMLGAIYIYIFSVGPVWGLLATVMVVGSEVHPNWMGRYIKEPALPGNQHGGCTTCLGGLPF